MDKIIIKQFAIQGKETEIIDIDTDTLKDELHTLYPDFMLEQYSYALREGAIVMLFVLKEKKINKVMGFVSG
jgi:hypothetical protein